MEERGEGVNTNHCLSESSQRHVDYTYVTINSTKLEAHLNTHSYTATGDTIIETNMNDTNCVSRHAMYTYIRTIKCNGARTPFIGWWTPEIGENLEGFTAHYYVVLP